MTFKFKGLIELEAHLDRTIDIMLKHNKKDIIEELHEPRRSELLMLSMALTDIKTPKIEEHEIVSSSASSKKAKASAAASKVDAATDINHLAAYYGLMLAARIHTGDLNGKLAKRLADAVGINEQVKDEDKPSTYDFSHFHEETTKYLQSKLFAANDSRQGIQKGHIFSAVAPEKLKELLEINYVLEKEAQIEVIKSLAVTEKQPARVYNKQTPETAVAVFPSWAKLIEALDTLIANELADKNVATINELDPARAAQLYFLEALGKQLKTAKIDEKEKIAILAGSMHVVHQQIKLEYKYLDPNSSLTYRELGALLHLKTAKTQDVEALLHAANQYLRYTTITAITHAHVNTREIYSKHPFASIEGFDLKGVLALLQNMICDTRVAASKLVFEALVHTAEAEKVLAKEPGASKSWIPSLPSLPSLSLGGMFGASAKKAEAEKAVVADALPQEQATSSTNLGQ